MERTTTKLAAAVVIVAGLVGAGTASAAAEDQGRADAAIAAFTDQVVEAGFESQGPSDETDVLDLRPADEDDDPTAAATNACLADLAQYIAEDGTFVGETARATSDDFTLAGDAPESTDPMAMSLGSSDEVAAVVAFVDDPAGVSAIVEAFAGGELLDCVEEAFLAIPPSSDAPLPSVTFDEEDLDLGDRAAEITLTSSFVFDEVEYRFSASIGLALVDRAIAVVTYDSTGDRVSDLEVADLLGTLVENLD
jgi:hypothetical protein